MKMSWATGVQAVPRGCLDWEVHSVSQRGGLGISLCPPAVGSWNRQGRVEGLRSRETLGAIADLHTPNLCARSGRASVTCHLQSVALQHR